MLEHRKQYHELSVKLRGQVVGACANLELIVEQFIATYFCPDDMKRIQNLIRLFFKENTGLTRKIEMVKYIAENEITGLLKTWPDIISDLFKIVECRNNLAHRYLDVSLQSVNDGNASNSIILQNLKKSIPPIVYSEDDVNAILDKIRDCSNILLYWHGTRTPFPLTFRVNALY